jgi:hypothetical protein
MKFHIEQSAHSQRTHYRWWVELCKVQPKTTANSSHSEASCRHFAILVTCCSVGAGKDSNGIWIGTVWRLVLLQVFFHSHVEWGALLHHSFFCGLPHSFVISHLSFPQGSFISSTCNNIDGCAILAKTNFINGPADGSSSRRPRQPAKRARRARCWCRKATGHPTNRSRRRCFHG